MPESITPGLWTGPLHLDLRNARDWSVGELDVSIARDTVEVRHQGRSLAVLDRDYFREWIFRPQFTYEVDDTVWTCELGVTVLHVGYSRFTVTADSMANLMTVI